MTDDTITVSRVLLQTLLDVVLAGEAATSGYLDTPDVEALRAAAELLGVDPAGVTPDGHRQHFRVPLDSHEAAVLHDARRCLQRHADHHGPLDAAGVSWRADVLRRYRHRPGWLEDGREPHVQALRDVQLISNADIVAKRRELAAAIARLESEQEGAGA